MLDAVLTFGSVCSGIEAASVAWEPLGWRASWFAEIEPFPSAVLKHHYPATPNLGDMSKLPELILNMAIDAPDVLCGGTPCQAFSVAGLRGSLNDTRGNLTLTFCEIANAIDAVRAVRGEPPAVIFWENVPGVLSTGDNAFGCFLARLSGETVPLEPTGGKWGNAGYVFGPQRTIAWRTLDAQYFGLAQRRKRIFVIASARTGFDPASILFEWESGRRDSAPGRAARQNAAPLAYPSTPSGGQEPVAIQGSMIGRGDLAGPAGIGASDEGVMYTLTSTDIHGVAAKSMPQIVGALTAKGPTAMGAPEVDAGHYLIQPQQWQAIPLDMRNGGRDPEKYDAINRQGLGVGEPGDPAHTLTSAFVHGVAQPVAYTLDSVASNSMKSANPFSGCNIAEITRALDTTRGLDPACNQGGLAVLQPMPFDTTHITSPENGSNPQPGAPCHPLSATAHPPAIAFSSVMSNPKVDHDMSPTLMAKYPVAVAFNEVGATLKGGSGARGYPDPSDGNGHNLVGQTSIFLQDDTTPKTQIELANTLRREAGGEGACVYANMIVRRLTPTECERLQGFGDGYTNVPWRGKPESPDGPRYKALGNSWAVPVVQWIGVRIMGALL